MPIYIRSIVSPSQGKKFLVGLLGLGLLAGSSGCGGALGTASPPTPPNDPAPALSISNVAASSITQTSATITWTTNQPATSQVEYGPTTNYGSSTALDSNLVTSHSQTVSGLEPGTLFHYRVHSQNADNVEAVDVDRTFTTASSGADNTPPSVSFTSPTSGSTVSGTITVSASASDDTGVAGVQFKLDGANLGSEDTSAPYSISWDTTSVADGTHSLSAQARDAAGNTGSASLSVVVDNPSPAPPPPVPPPPASAGSPRLFFTDLESGPRTGNSDTSLGQVAGANGAIVTLWGRSLGTSQGDSTISINGAQVQHIYSWGNATGPAADLFSRLGAQAISFQIPSAATDGPGTISLTVNGETSNTLPFTVRTGNIFFVKTTGNDSTGDGSWTNPWQSIKQAKDSLAPGDIAYIGDGITLTTTERFGAAVALTTDGTLDRPKALVAYPGATVNVGTTSMSGFWNFNSGTGSRSVHWVISKFRITCQSVCIRGHSGFRIVGNFMTAPLGSGATGVIPSRGDRVKVLGNEFFRIGDPTNSDNNLALYHVIYFQGARPGTTPRAPTERDREAGWNYFHDIQAHRSINIFNFDSPEGSSAFIEEHHIHDNWIENQRGDCILAGSHMTGENWFYNNVCFKTFLVEGGVSSAAINIRAGTGAFDDPGNSVVHLYNNTFFDTTSDIIIMRPDLLTEVTLKMHNNILRSVGGEGYISTKNNTVPTDDYSNLYFGNGAGPSFDTGAINSDPQFVDSAAGNFRLQDSSPAIDNGVSAPSFIVQADLDGVGRPQGSAFDIGAYEFHLGTPPATEQSLTIVGSEILLNGSPVMPFGLRAANALISDAKTDELIAQLDSFRSVGLQQINISLMGARDGNIQSFNSNGTLTATAKTRITRILDAIEARAMVAVVTYFYQQRDQDLVDEAAIFRAIDEATLFLLPWRNVWAYAVNEFGSTRYDHSIFLDCTRRQDILDRIKAIDPDRVVSVGGLRSICGSSVGDLNAHTGQRAQPQDSSGRPDVIVENARNESGKGIYSDFEKAENMDRAGDSATRGGYWFWHSGWVQDPPPNFVWGGSGTSTDPGDSWLYNHLATLP